ncbi:MAG: nucleoside-diphosphate kinase [Limnochordaceae bacterium]|nr:nucleoside-diphosphate kinase [Limnochordaceae bacterium]
MEERTLIIVKPEGVARGLTGEILSRFERKGLKLVALKLGRVTPEQARVHYGHHADKPFFPDLIAAITAGPVVFAVFEGENAIRLGRLLIGATNPLEALPGTIRGDLALDSLHNLVHASDGPETARAEIQRFFGVDPGLLGEEEGK